MKKLERMKHKYFSTTQFDPTSERYAVYEDCLSREQIETIRARIIAQHPTPRRVQGELVEGKWVQITNEANEVVGGSRRFQLYCSAELKRAGIDLLQILKDKGYLASGFKESSNHKGASIIYCMTPHGSKAKRQGWHVDFADRFDGGTHLSVIVALSDGIKLPSRGGRLLSEDIPAGNDATDFVPIPLGACIIFRGDHIHAGMRGTGCQQFRLHMYLAEVKRKADVLKEPNRVYFTSSRRRVRR